MPAPLLTKAKVHKLKRLLYMQYKPAEIAEELGIAADTVYRTYLPAGAPHTKDDAGNIWIVGTDFYNWAKEYLTTRQRKPKPAMAANEGYCLHCQKVIEMQEAKEQSRNGRGVINLAGKCPTCGGKVNRMISGRASA